MPLDRSRTQQGSEIIHSRKCQRQFVILQTPAVIGMNLIHRRPRFKSVPLLKQRLNQPADMPGFQPCNETVLSTKREFIGQFPDAFVPPAP